MNLCKVGIGKDDNLKWMTKEYSIWSGLGEGVSREIYIRGFPNQQEKRKKKNKWAHSQDADRKDCRNACMIVRRERIHLTQRNKSRVVALTDQQSRSIPSAISISIPVPIAISTSPTIIIRLTLRVPHLRPPLPLLLLLMHAI